MIVVQKTPARRSVTGATPGKTTAVISSPFEKVNNCVVRKELCSMCVQCKSESAKTSNNKIYVCKIKEKIFTLCHIFIVASLLSRDQLVKTRT